MIVKKLPFSEFKSIYSRVPRLCVEIMVKTNNGVLLLKRNIDPEKGKWHLPGGTVLKGERLEDTVKRVAMEEIGVKVKVGEVLDIIEYFIKGYFGQMVGIIFSVKPISKNFKIDKNAQEFRFFKIIPKNTIKQHKKFLNKRFGFEKKCDLDVEMAVDLIKERENYDTIILFSGDGDLMCAIKYLKEEYNKTCFVFSARGQVMYTDILHFSANLRAYENNAQINKRRKISLDKTNS